MRHWQKLSLIGLGALLPVAASAQNIYGQEQLDQLVAPIALYPDDLLMQVLVASERPQQIVQAAQWANDSAFSQMPPAAVAQQLEQAQWDDSVKALTAAPQVLQTLSDNIGWTQSLGAAFVRQPDDVMDAVQDLRHDAQESGSLYSTSQQTVYEQGDDIAIQSAVPNSVYVPTYDPGMVYGEWLSPQYPPYYFVASYHPRHYIAPAVAVGPLYTIIQRTYWPVHQWNWAQHNDRGRPPFDARWQNRPQQDTRPDMTRHTLQAVQPTPAAQPAVVAQQAPVQQPAVTQPVAAEPHQHHDMQEHHDRQTPHPQAPANAPHQEEPARANPPAAEPHNHEDHHDNDHHDDNRPNHP